MATASWSGKMAAKCRLSLKMASRSARAQRSKRGVRGLSSFRERRSLYFTNCSSCAILLDQTGKTTASQCSLNLYTNRAACMDTIAVIFLVGYRFYSC
mmetsp:Transcript_2203/g.4166  ORF Transcript_2203/g.4166 Transcript_2203/m.4166 type:complete len:98 (-) Transcript_2203:51-344(-)